MNVLIYGKEEKTHREIAKAVGKTYADADVSAFFEASLARAAVTAEAPDLALIDLDGENGKGKALAALIRAKNEKANLILFSGDDGFSADSLKLYPSAYLIKPLTACALQAELIHLRYPL